MQFDYISFGYAVLVAAGGIVGYVKAGSWQSLVAGLLFGTALGLGVVISFLNPSRYHLSIATNVALVLVMGYRFMSSGKPIPAGLITVLSLLMILRFIARSNPCFPYSEKF